MWLDHLILFLGWLLFYGIHSALATQQVKDWTGLKPQTYRLLYNTINGILFLAILLFGAMIYSILILPPSPFTNYFGLMLAATGLFIIKRSFRNYSLGAFLGFKKNADESLKRTGLQAKVRHPLYSGTLLLVIGYFFFNPQLTSLVILVALIVYLPLGIKWEEQKLVAHYGEEYNDYRKNVPSIFPKLNFNKS